MKSRNKILWITQTAIFLALLVVLQGATAPLGSPLITGSVVNLLLILSVMRGGLTSGLAVAVFSPALAKLLGIGPLWELIPWIIAGNLSLILVWHFVGNLRGGKLTFRIAALLAAAAAKSAVLYIGIVKIAVPLFLKLPEPQAAVISGMFSISQLFTALIGGFLALLILPVLQKALQKK